ncbi:MAG: TIGR03619 family F420-dependent LLM class oxidoreductase [Mycobacteriales bacterium]
MRFALELPTRLVDRPDEFLGVRAIAEMASAVEAAGLDAVHVSDHPYPPAQWVAAGGHHAMDPLVALTAAAAGTSSLQLITNIYVLAYRHPAVAAHGLGSLAVASGDRLVVGVGPGYLRAEFDGLEANHAHRGRLLDEALPRLLSVWRGEAGPHGNMAEPLPKVPPPVWIGGNSAAALRRTVELGQGWMPFPAPAALAAQTGTDALPDHATLAARIEALRGAWDAAGRMGSPVVCCAPFSHPFGRPGLRPAELIEDAAVMAEAGVSWLCLSLDAPSRAGWLENVQRVAEQVARPLARA